MDLHHESKLLHFGLLHVNNHLVQDHEETRRGERNDCTVATLLVIPNPAAFFGLTSPTVSNTALINVVRFLIIVVIIGRRKTVGTLLSFLNLL